MVFLEMVNLLRRKIWIETDMKSLVRITNVCKTVYYRKHDCVVGFLGQF